MKGGSFLSHIQTAFHQFCLISPRRRLRWECHKWPESNVGLPHPADLQRSSKIFYFFSLFHFLPSFLKRSNSCHLPQYPFNSSCFSNLPFPLYLNLSCQIIWRPGLESIFHSSTMVNQWHQSCTTCGSSWRNCMSRWKRPQLLYTVGVCVRVRERERESICSEHFVLRK